MSDQPSSRIGRTSAIEQHAQTIVGLIIAALIFWVGNTAQTTAVKVAELGTRLESLSDVDRESARKTDEQIAMLAAAVREHQTRLAVIESRSVDSARASATPKRIDNP